jgi:hypothetical protein
MLFYIYSLKRYFLFVLYDKSKLIMTCFPAIFTLLVMNIFDGGKLDSDSDRNCLIDLLFIFAFIISMIIGVVLDFVTSPIQIIITGLVWCYYKICDKSSSNV